MGLGVDVFSVLEVFILGMMCISQPKPGISETRQVLNEEGGHQEPKKVCIWI